MSMLHKNARRARVTYDDLADIMLQVNAITDRGVTNDADLICRTAQQVKRK